MMWHLAQVNIGRFRKPVEDAANADFVNALDHVNALAEAAPGFVWRLTGDGNSATDLKPFDDPNMAINMSVWESVDALAAFVYRNLDHRGVMRRRREWFEEMPVYMALWWIPAGSVPTVEDAKARLALLEANGPTAEAFTFRQPFAAPSGDAVRPVLDRCA
jgi:heme-degrading monooxygenase HmoA